MDRDCDAVSKLGCFWRTARFLWVTGWHARTVCCAVLVACRLPDSCSDKRLLLFFLFGAVLFCCSWRQPVMGLPRATKALTRRPPRDQQWQRRAPAGIGKADTGHPLSVLLVPRVGTPLGCCCVAALARVHSRVSNALLYCVARRRPGRLFCFVQPFLLHCPMNKTEGCVCVCESLTLVQPFSPFGLSWV